jgi:hypothetical protein
MKLDVASALVRAWAARSLDSTRNVDFYGGIMNSKITAGALAVALAIGSVATSATDASAQRWGHRGGWSHHRHGGWGWGAGAGFAAGALLGGALASRPYYGSGPGYYYDDPGYYAAAPGGGRDDAYCSQRFKSYDPSSGTYLGYDGKRHPCP